MVSQYVPYTIKLNETSMSLTQNKQHRLNAINRLTPGKTKLKPLIFVSFICYISTRELFYFQFSNMISVTDPFPSKNTSHCLIIDYKTERTFQKLQLKTDVKACEHIRDILVSHRVPIQSEQRQRSQRRRQSNILFWLQFWLLKSRFYAILLLTIPLSLQWISPAKVKEKIHFIDSNCHHGLVRRVAGGKAH